MLSKPMEGLIDTNITEPAFDVANIYVSNYEQHTEQIINGPFIKRGNADEAILNSTRVLS